MELAEFGDSADTALLALATATSSGPVWLHLLVADRCNHTCQHCYQVQGLKGEMPREQIEALLREFRARGGFVVDFSGGEATLRDDLVQLLAYAHELGLATILYTNGFTMTEDLASALAACHVWRVEISVYSHRAEEHDAVTRVPGSWQKTTHGIRWLRAKGVNVILKFTPTAPSTATAADLADLARDLDAHLFVAELLNAGEAGRSEPARVRRRPEQVVAEFKAPPSNALDAKPCGAGSQLNVRSDGQIQPCSQLNTPMGQIGEQASGLDEIATSNVAQFFREVTWNDLHGCRDCDVRAHCSRCFASAAAEVGDMLAPYRAACELAVERYRRASGHGPLLAPDADCSSDRDPAVGPYRLMPEGGLQPAADRRTPRDGQLVERHPWLRPSREALEVSACGADATSRERGLVQLRRRETKLLDAVRTPT